MQAICQKSDVSLALLWLHLELISHHNFESKWASIAELCGAVPINPRPENILSRSKLRPKKMGPLYLFFRCEFHSGRMEWLKLHVCLYQYFWLHICLPNSWCVTSCRFDCVWFVVKMNYLSPVSYGRMHPQSHLSGSNLYLKQMCATILARIMRFSPELGGEGYAHSFFEASWLGVRFMAHHDEPFG